VRENALVRETARTLTVRLVSRTRKNKLISHGLRRFDGSHGRRNRAAWESMIYAV